MGNLFGWALLVLGWGAVIAGALYIHPGFGMMVLGGATMVLAYTVLEFKP